jgi:hypothetical protein
MDLSKFSLDYLKPTPSDSEDPWEKALRFYGVPVLMTLQQEGKKSIGDLYNIVKGKLNARDLQLDQFSEVVRRLADSGQISVAQEGSKPDDTVVALPLERASSRR